MVRELACHAELSGSDGVLINMANPGFCMPSNIFHLSPRIAQLFVRFLALLVARTTDVGARTLLAAVEAGPATHGRYLESGVASMIDPYITSDEGVAMQSKLWGEFLAVLEGIEPGVTRNIFTTGNPS